METTRTSSWGSRHGVHTWGLYTRPEFENFGHRYTSFLELLSIDRVGSSFIVDLVIFATFQSWLVDDDLRRQGVTPEVELTFLRYAAKFVPFFGLVAYSLLRPELPTQEAGGKQL